MKVSLEVVFTSIKHEHNVKFTDTQFYVVLCSTKKMIMAQGHTSLAVKTTYLAGM